MPITQRFSNVNDMVLIRSFRYRLLGEQCQSLDESFNDNEWWETVAWFDTI